jgi:hypothetical protein
VDAAARRMCQRVRGHRQVRTDLGQRGLFCRLHPLRTMYMYKRDTIHRIYSTLIIDLHHPSHTLNNLNKYSMFTSIVLHNSVWVLEKLTYKNSLQDSNIILPKREAEDFRQIGRFGLKRTLTALTYHFALESRFNWHQTQSAGSRFLVRCLSLRAQQKPLRLLRSFYRLPNQ